MITGRLIRAIQNLAEHEHYDLDYSREVTRLARDVAAEYARLEKQERLRAEEEDRL